MIHSCVYRFANRVYNTQTCSHLGVAEGTQHEEGQTSSEARTMCELLRTRTSTNHGMKTEKYMHNGDTIPVVSHAYDVCRVVLCNICFWHVHDHRCRGRPSGVLTLRWLVYLVHIKTIVSLILIFWFICECEWTTVTCDGFLCDFIFFCEQYYFFWIFMFFLCSNDVCFVLYFYMCKRYM